MTSEGVYGVKYWAKLTPDHIALTVKDKAMENKAFEKNALDPKPLETKDNTVSITWSQLYTKITSLSLQLLSQGIEPGDVIAAVSKNDETLLYLYLACIEMGAICATLAPQTESQLKQKLALLGTDKVWLGSGCKQLGGVTGFVTINTELDSLSKPNHDALLKSIQPSLIQKEQLASIIFTSGSTGTPKAVAHQAQQHIASAQGLIKRLPFHTKDTWLLSLPMYHVSGMAIIWRWLSVGARLKIADGDDLLSALTDVTHASLVATQLQRLLKQSTDQNKPLTLKHALMGGGHIPDQLAAQANQQGVDTWVGYGMTEAASTVTLRNISTEKQGVGTVLANRQLKLDGQRIFVGGETLAAGYYQQGKLTPISHEQLSDGEAWFDTKDLGYMLDGQLVILGRADNQFISGGENIHCEEIETVLKQHKLVTDAVVIPVKDEEFGARPVAVVISSQQLNNRDFQHLLESKLEKYKWPIDYIWLSPQQMQSESELTSSQVKVPRALVKAWFSNKYHQYKIN